MRNIMLVTNETGDELCIEKHAEQNKTKKTAKNTHEDTTHACE